MFLNTYIPEPVAFSVFGIEIMWYGVFIGAGMLIGACIMYYRAPKHEIKPDRTLDILIVSIPVGIIGARAYFLMFNWADYSGDLFRIINIRSGGLAIHGGLILGMLAALLLCRRWEIRPLNLFDLAAPSIAIAQAFGRWGNYFNQEAHGGPTDLPWAIPAGGQMVHPTFLYESLWCFLLFFILIFVDNRRSFYGQVILLYGMLYSFERFFVEMLRTDSLMLGIFKQAQVLSCVVFVICFIAYFVLRKNRKHNDRIFY